MRGCRVLTRPAQHLGRAGHLATWRCGIPASASAAEVLPLATRSQPSRPAPGPGRPARSCRRPRAAPSRAHLLGPYLADGRPSTPWTVSSSSARRWCRVEPPLDHLDPLVQGLDGVVGQDRHRLLGQDRPGVHLERGQVHRAPRHLHPGRQRVLHGVPAGEGRQQGRVGVEDPAAEGVVDRLGRAPCRSRPWRPDPARGRPAPPSPARCTPSGRTRAEAAPLAAVDQLSRHPGRSGDLQPPAGTVGEHHADRDPGVQHGLEDRPTPRNQHRDAHGRQTSVPPACTSNPRPPFPTAGSSGAEADQRSSWACALIFRIDQRCSGATRVRSFPGETRVGSPSPTTRYRPSISPLAHIPRQHTLGPIGLPLRLGRRTSWPRGPSPPRSAPLWLRGSYRRRERVATAHSSWRWPELGTKTDLIAVRQSVREMNPSTFRDHYFRETERNSKEFNELLKLGNLLRVSR